MTGPPLPTTLKDSSITAIVDTREKNLLDLDCGIEKARSNDPGGLTPRETWANSFAVGYLPSRILAIDPRTHFPP